MITKTQATQIKNNYRRPIWYGEDFSQAVIRLHKEITESASNGADGISSVFNPAYRKALLAILHEHGFADSKMNPHDDFRIDINW